MTIDEAIKEAKVSAVLYRKEAYNCIQHGGSVYEEKARACKETAEENEQIAEWFEELKLLKAREPSIDIVRCKECKYFIDNLTENDADEAYDACRWDWGRRIPKPDDFCSYGERREP